MNNFEEFDIFNEDGQLIFQHPLKGCSSKEVLIVCKGCRKYVKKSEIMGNECKKCIKDINIYGPWAAEIKSNMESSWYITDKLHKPSSEESE